MVGHITVAVLGRDPVIAHTLELLLSGVGYQARTLTTSALGISRGLLDGVGIVLLTSGSDHELREALVSEIGNAPGPRIPVLELVSVLASGLDPREDQVPWPCRMEELKRRIDGALRIGARQG